MSARLGELTRGAQIDTMRRLVKEEMLRFDGARLFPERRAYSPIHQLSDAEAELNADVTATPVDMVGRKANGGRA